MANGFASSPTVASPCANCRTMARRVGSASAENTALSSRSPIPTPDDPFSTIWLNNKTAERSAQLGRCMERCPSQRCPREGTPEGVASRVAAMELPRPLSSVRRRGEDSRQPERSPRKVVMAHTGQGQTMPNRPKVKTRSALWSGPSGLNPNCGGNLGSSRLTSTSRDPRRHRSERTSLYPDGVG